MPLYQFNNNNPSLKYPVFFVLLFGLAMSSDMVAQKGHELGGWIGTSFYYGDLNNSVGITQPGIAGGLNARYNFNTRVCFKGSLNYGRIGADDANSDNNFERNRNLKFKSHLIDLTAAFEFNFFNYVHGSPDEYYTPYLLAGLNVFHYNPKAELDGQTYALRDFTTELNEYGSVNMGFVLGGGWKYDLTYDLSINIEASYRKLFTDYIDDVSTVFPDKNLLLAQKGPTAVALSDRSLVEGIGTQGRQRGNSKDNDAYVFAGISIMKYFGRLECPKISKI